MTVLGLVVELAWNVVDRSQQAPNSPPCILSEDKSGAS